MIRTLENILDDISDDNANAFLSEVFPLPSLTKFSDKKNLFGFQHDALINSLKALFLFYEINEGKKNSFFNVYENSNISLQPCKYLNCFSEYEEDFPRDVKEKDISFVPFCNRMSFWMATGSGKTLVIIKLMEILDGLMKSGKLPERDILFLTHRQELIDQFKKLVDEFNQSSEVKINIHNLKDFSRVKYENPSILTNNIDVFYYRSDLISDVSKKNIINFRSYDNEGKWFILLDEAHKGAKTDISKRQAYYSIMARKGFLFNFSATFTEENDNATCAFNFNLDRFIERGYGKQIYLSEQNVEGFDKGSDFPEKEKQKIVLKTLIFHTYISEYVVKARNKSGEKDIYHRPLLVGLVNSVNLKKDEEIRTKIPDLQLLFDELDRVANNELIKGLFEEAHQELVDEMSDGNYSIGEEKRIPINKKFLSKITYRQLLKSVFNADKPGNIEALRIPNNKKEIAFKLHTSTQPFALIRIGDNTSWFRNVLHGKKEISETWQGKSLFGALNNPDSSINILLGSRAFYEGWDSNRPNIILFVNIGIGPDAKKFVLQSIGRGVRIEPVANQRRRLMRLLAENKKLEGLYTKIKKYTHAPESLFIFGTNAKSLKSIMDFVTQERGDKSEIARDLGDLFEETLAESVPADNSQLPIPKYKPVDTSLPDVKLPNYSINESDLKLSKKFLTNIGDRVAVMMYKCSPKVLSRVKHTFENESQFYAIDQGTSIPKKPFLSVLRIINYFDQTTEEFVGFAPLTEEIRHHTKISFVGPDNLFEELKEKIKIMANYPERKAQLESMRYDKDVTSDELRKRSADIENANTLDNILIEIKHLANHYYNPLLISKKEKQDYLKNIIQVESEVKFINQLVEIQPKLDAEFEWWMFSKINEKWDDVGLPYYNPDRNVMTTYHPDFIFWLKEKNSKNLHIVFVDPHGTAHAGYQRKADWYSHTFGEPGEEKNIPYDDMEVKLYLKFFTNDKVKASDGYRKYWIQSIEEIATIGKNPLPQ